MNVGANRQNTGAHHYMAEDNRRDQEAQPRKLPSNVEAEAALIGAILIDNRIIDRCINLEPEHFFEPLHMRIFRRTRALINEGKTVNPVLLKPYFENDPTIIELGGPGYLVKLTADGSGLIGAKDFCDQIIMLAKLRELIEAAMLTANDAANSTEDIDSNALIERLSNTLIEIGDSATESTISTVGRAYSEVVRQIEDERHGVGHPEIRPRHIEAWNDAIDGMAAGDLTILAGRPGMMKTGVALHVAMATALDGIATSFFSLEMSKRQLIVRALSDIAFDDPYDSPLAKHIKRMNLDAFERERVDLAGKLLDDAPLEIDVDPMMTIAKLSGRIRASKRRWAARNRQLRLVVVDYLQLMTGTGKRRDENRVQELSEISRGLKLVAKQNDIHIIALSQLSRSVEQREDKRPILSDLRESGSIEQDADNVVFVYRESYYRGHYPPKNIKPGTAAYSDWEADSEAVKNDLELIARKVRSGDGGTRKFYVSLPHQAIRDVDWRDKGGFL